jgi:hypothetical protein
MNEIGLLFLRAGLCSLSVSALAWIMEQRAPRNRRWWV